LRPGGITKEQLEKVLGTIDVATSPEDATPLSPGMLVSHYAPNLPLRLNADKVESDEALLAFGPDVFIKGGEMRLNLSPQGDLSEAAANLFAMLRQLDQSLLRAIAVMPIPNVGLGVAINDRLQRASVR
jgi:L-threonylcarbamoyladenylate synthase